MKIIKKQNWKWGRMKLEVKGEIITVFQNDENNQWYATNEKTCELEAYGKTKKSVLEQLKNKEEE